MNEAEVIFANNRAVICFWILIIGILTMYAKISDIHIRRVFCLSRRKNMEYVTKHGIFVIVCFASAGMTLYEILSIVRGYAHITFMIALFFLAGTAFIVFWVENVVSVNNVWWAVVGICFVICVPLVMVFTIILYHVEFDKYLGYATVLMILAAAVNYHEFVDGWKKGDLP